MAQNLRGVPRKNPVADIDKEIGRRLRAARDDRAAKRSAVALRVGISPDQLANYEMGRAPLPWIAGNAICKLLDISQVWLASGISNAEFDGYQAANLEDVSQDVLKRKRFSDAFREFFKPRLEAQQIQDLADLLGRKGSLVTISKGLRALEHDRRLAPVQLMQIMAELDELKNVIERTRNAIKSDHPDFPAWL